METYEIFKDLAIIIFTAKIGGIIAKKFGAPEVVGQIVMGIIIGPSLLGLVQQSDFISKMAEIGVVLLMFSAGLGTDIKELLHTGPIAFLIACAGVFIPLAGGWLLYSTFYGFSEVGSNEFLKAVFIGVIMTATSVSITVQTLRELGHLKGKVGTTILSAAIIDDVIGLIVLTFVISFKSPDTDVFKMSLNFLIFFALSFIFGLIMHKLFAKLGERYHHHRRLAIIGLAVAFAMAYVAEKFFGIADITGAYIAGVILCSLQESNYVERKMDISSYILFGPVFFASIGLKTSFDNFSSNILVFAILFVVVALVTKIIGCGLMALLCKFKFKDSLKIGVGMMTRGEVALIVSQKGMSVGLIEPIYFSSVILLIVVSSVITPIVLKILYKGDESEAEVVQKA